MFDWQAELAPSALNFGIKESRQLSTVLTPSPVKSTVAPTVQMTSAAPKPSFAQALRGNMVLSDPLPVPSIRGEILSVKITDDVYFRGGFAFPLAIEYEGRPDFCKHCKSIEHDVSKCRWLYPRKDESNNKVTAPPAVTNTVPTTSALTQEPQGLQQHATQDDVEQSIPVIRDVVPRITDATTTHSSPFTLQYDATREIQQEKLPITSVHVLEEVTATQEEPVEVTNAATTQLPLQDVMELERSAHNQGIPTAETNDVTTKTGTYLNHTKI